MKTLFVIAALALPMAAHAQARTHAAAAQFQAEAKAAPLVPVAADAAPAKPGSDLADPRLFRVTVEDPAMSRPKGTIQTAVDHRFSQRALGSIGYLCGMQPGPLDGAGIRSASAPAGTFLGGQLKVAF
jgi:hypothetical protein